MVGWVVSTLGYLSHSLQRLVSCCEGDECVAPGERHWSEQVVLDQCHSPVQSSHWIHHQTKIPDLAALLEVRNQLVLVDILGNLATEHLQRNRILFDDQRLSKLFERYLASGSWWGTVPAWRRSSVLPLTRGHVKTVSCNVIGWY